MAEKKKRIYELANIYKISSNAMVNILRDLKYDPKSHMSVATPEMIAAVKNKFTLERQVAKKEMVQKTKAKEARARKSKTAAEPAALKDAATPDKSAVPSGSRANIGGITVTDSKAPVAEVMRRLEKKKKKRERRKKKGRRGVDQAEVAKSFKSTMATLGGSKTKKKYKRHGDDDVDSDAAEMDIIEVNEFMSVAELAKLMDEKPVAVITKLFELGMMATINQRLDLDTIGMIAGEFGFEIREMEEIGQFAREDESEEGMETVAPVVTVMGHVDHGKTSLLDYIRKTNVVAGEAGAITQHIGASEVSHDNKKIVFLDTPGHEAFTAMRARGAQITDLVVIVVAADEAVKPQTVEAIDHARAAGVPMLVAINKIDKPNANVDTVRTQLANHNLMDEQWGGKTIMVEVSAKTGEGVSNLLDMVLLQAEIMDLKADPSIRAQGVIVDAKLERGRGPVATVLVQKGTCKVGDCIVAGTHSGHVRTMTNDRDQSLTQIGPASPAQVTGLNGVPQAGDSFLVVKDTQEARDITIKRGQVKREYEFRRPHGVVTLEKVFDRIKEGQIKEVRLIVKGDVTGSVEVLSDTLGKISTSEVKTHIIRQGVGAITESDVLLAAASDAIIIGFHVAPDLRARDLASREKVDIRQYTVIYEVEDDIRKALEGLLAPDVSEKFVGVAEVRDIFKIPKIGTVAGSYVKDGLITRSDRVRLLRDGKIIYHGKLGSLRRFKEDVKEVKEGFECGISIENYNDVKVGDILETYTLVETARTLD
jgi:translation initiation factor IF-2